MPNTSGTLAKLLKTTCTRYAIYPAYTECIIKYSSSIYEAVSDGSSLQLHILQSYKHACNCKLYFSVCMHV